MDALRGYMAFAPSALPFAGIDCSCPQEGNGSDNGFFLPPALGHHVEEPLHRVIERVVCAIRDRLREKRGGHKGMRRRWAN